MSKIEIIKAEFKDSPSVVEIFNNARAEMTYLPIVHTPTEVNNFFTSLVKNGDIWIAKFEDKVVAFMEIKEDWLHHLYVVPNFQNRGIGKSLLDKAKQESPKRISLWIFEDNREAIKFYEREGFILQEKRTEAQTTNEEYLPDRKYIWS